MIPCSSCGQPYEIPEETRAKWKRIRPETEGLCLKCINALSYGRED
jgi:hypothetical protein